MPSDIDWFAPTEELSDALDVMRDYMEPQDFMCLMALLHGRGVLANVIFDIRAIEDTPYRLILSSDQAGAALIQIVKVN